MKSFWYRLKRLKSDIFILYYACKDPRVPRQAKVLAVLLAAYVISPVDLFPDFIFPGLGYMDDLLLVPFGTEFILKLIPGPVVVEAKQKAMHLGQRAKLWATVLIGAAVILLVLAFAYRFVKIG
ncbi:hypothetical protein DCCM_4887 [Desulfocucumis palustris]|uniref:DUF1232 domain-containing protein n=1 Tax=Desulfocucumis palustris TaxID=1898651 RepID=A0A2L2XHZ5_9FIRM|nr:DUF1232 domain-containing protein [Desulfocucumis palustris]GBF35752.1 hypothetical protein DCCM_4887 [Desulfocucumis palustris]